MSENVRMWLEILFNISYLVTVWGLVILMRRRRSVVAPADQRVSELVTLSFALLASGDTLHLGFRILGYASGDLERSTFTAFGMRLGLVGIGALATGLTVTVFYMLMLYAWRDRFNKRLGWFGYLMLATAAVRLLIMASPANEWNNVVPPQPWSTYRNLPLMIQGLGLAFLILRDARAANDQTFNWIGVWILVSYACYMPVVFWVQRAPMVGMLMIPKTLAYVAIAVVAYRDLFGTATVPAITAGGSD